MSAVSIVTALALAGGATFAFFSSSATSSSNTFSSGTLELFVNDGDEDPAVDNTVLASITATDFAPGESVTGFVSLDNSGSIDIAEVEMTTDTSETADPDADSDMRNVLNLTVILDDTTPDTACSGGTDMTSTIDAQVGNGGSPLTLAEFDDGTDVFDAFLTGTGLTAGAVRNVCFEIEFDSGAGNIYQGDAVDTTFTFTANQDASQ